MEKTYYLISSSSFGEFGIIWNIRGGKPRITRLTLPGKYPQLKVALRMNYPLASNPFPILIPCHRAVRSSGELGGYQGGLEMKKALLEMEGVIFRSNGQVSLNKVYYAI